MPRTTSAHPPEQEPEPSLKDLEAAYRTNAIYNLVLEDGVSVPKAASYLGVDPKVVASAKRELKGCAPIKFDDGFYLLGNPSSTAVLNNLRIRGAWVPRTDSAQPLLSKETALLQSHPVSLLIDAIKGGIPVDLLTTPIPHPGRILEEIISPPKPKVLAPSSLIKIPGADGYSIDDASFTALMNWFEKGDALPDYPIVALTNPRKGYTVTDKRSLFSTVLPREAVPWLADNDFRSANVASYVNGKDSTLFLSYYEKKVGDDKTLAALIFILPPDGDEGGFESNPDRLKRLYRGEILFTQIPDYKDTKLYALSFTQDQLPRWVFERSLKSIACGTASLPSEQYNISLTGIEHRNIIKGLKWCGLGRGISNVTALNKMVKNESFEEFSVKPQIRKINNEDEEVTHVVSQLNARGLSGEKPLGVIVHATFDKDNNQLTALPQFFFTSYARTLGLIDESSPT